MVLNSCASVLRIARDKSFTYRLRFRSMSTFDLITKPSCVLFAVKTGVTPPSLKSHLASLGVFLDSSGCFWPPDSRIVRAWHPSRSRVVKSVVDAPKFSYDATTV